MCACFALGGGWFCIDREHPHVLRDTHEYLSGHVRLLRLGAAVEEDVLLARVAVHVDVEQHAARLVRRLEQRLDRGDLGLQDDRARPSHTHSLYRLIAH